MRFAYAVLWTLAVAPGFLIVLRSLFRALRARRRLRVRAELADYRAARLMPDADSFVLRQRLWSVMAGINVTIGLIAVIEVIVDGPFAAVSALIGPPLLILGQVLLSYASYVDDKNRQRKIPTEHEDKQGGAL